MITETLIALSVIALTFVYFGLKSESQILRMVFISASLLLLMTFFYQMGLFYAAYQNPNQLILANTTTATANTTIYHYINSTSAGYNQNAINGISQVWFDWAMVMGFITFIYLLIEYIVYKIIGGVAENMQKGVNR